MREDQRSRALRLADALEVEKWHVTAVTMQDAANILRELAAEAAPVAQPARVPMTDEQGIALANAVSSPNDATWIRDSDQCVLRIVRATEVAHGITGGAK